ncbi:hypothetical protein C8J57DRAFT_1253771 [Mycena rebaudengoi]|nr:hypothetical protein C8J57DRAFT_1253771 [Mycena rebaudengoi]
MAVRFELNTHLLGERSYIPIALGDPCFQILMNFGASSFCAPGSPELSTKPPTLPADTIEHVPSPNLAPASLAVLPCPRHSRAAVVILATARFAVLDRRNASELAGHLLGGPRSTAPLLQRSHHVATSHFRLILPASLDEFS